MSCEGPVGPFDGHTGTRPQPGDGRRVISDALHRETQEGRSRKRRERERVGLPPHPLGKEAPLKELPPCDREAVEVLTTTDDRDRARSFRVDLYNLEAVSERPEQGQPESVDEHQASGRGPEHRPDEPRERVPHERWSERDLVSERESKGEVRSEERRVGKECRSRWSRC